MATDSVPTVLLTGFDPFGGDSINPSWDAVQRLRGKRVAGHRVVVEQLPTEFARAATMLASALRRHRPRLALCVGQAGGRAAISIERVALNIIDARIPDNAKAQPIDVAVIDGAPLAYFASLPIKSMVEALRKDGIPADVSNSAGTYVCNAVFFRLAHHIQTRARRMRGGFVHIPFVPAQVTTRPGVPSMGEDVIVRALLRCVQVALSVRDDVATAEGTTH